MANQMSNPMLLTEEELRLVKLSILLPLILNTLDHDNKALKAAGLKVPRVYIANNKHIQHHILLEIPVIKRELFKRGIEVFEQGKTPTGYQAKFLCRGYRHEISWLSGHIKSLVVSRLSEMMGFPIELLTE